MAERSYPGSEVGAVAERRHPASDVRVVAERNYLASEASGGRVETPRVRGQAGGWEEQPEEWWLHSTGGPRGAIPLEVQKQWR